jgi:hypothetical protein
LQHKGKKYLGFPMIIDGSKKFKMLQALNGNKTAMCELIDSEFEADDNMFAYWCLQLLVENKPEVCETKLREIAGEELAYEQMLILIAERYYYDLNDHEEGYSWYQKTFDYLRYKYRNLSADEIELKLKEWNMYEYMKQNYLLDRIEYRFLLKWEHEIFYKKV